MNAAKPGMIFVRSGAVALGKYESGQPSHSDASLTSVIPIIEPDRSAAEWIPKTSCSQIDTQAMNVHKNVNGSRAATSLFGGCRAITNSGA